MSLRICCVSAHATVESTEDSGELENKESLMSLRDLLCQCNSGEHRGQWRTGEQGIIDESEGFTVSVQQWRAQRTVENWRTRNC